LEVTAPTITFDTLPNGPNSPFSGKIRAKDEQGLGPLSAAVTGYTLAAPAVASSLQFLNVGVTSVTLTWDPNGNPDKTRWVISRSLPGGATTTITVAPAAAAIASPGISIAGLTANTT